MILAKVSDVFRTELHSESELSLHVGPLSLDIPTDDFIEIANMFNPRIKKEHDGTVCSVMRGEGGKFIFAYRSVMFSLCGGGLNKLSSLVEESMRNYHAFFNRNTAESMADIESILTDIEKRHS